MGWERGGQEGFHPPSVNNFTEQRNLHWARRLLCLSPFSSLLTQRGLGFRAVCVPRDTVTDGGPSGEEQRMGRVLSMRLGASEVHSGGRGHVPRDSFRAPNSII